MRLTVLAAFLALMALVACSREPKPPAAASAGAGATPQAPAPASMSSALISGDAEGLRNYLQTVQETPARRFEVEWNPDVVAVDRAAALRSLHGISRDGATFRFAAGDPALAALAPGRILFLWGIAVRRVSAVQTVDGELVVSTTETSLSEIFRNANIEIDYALRPQSPTGRAARAGRGRAGGDARRRVPPAACGRVPVRALRRGRAARARRRRRHFRRLRPRHRTRTRRGRATRCCRSASTAGA